MVERTKKPAGVCHRAVGAYIEWLESDNDRLGATNFVFVLIVGIVMLFGAVVLSIEPLAALHHGATLDMSYQSTGRHGVVTVTPIRPIIEGCAIALSVSALILSSLLAYWKGWLEQFRPPARPARPSQYHW